MTLAQHPEFQAGLQMLAAHFESVRESWDIPGLSAGVVYDQELVWSQGFGYADLESQRPATPDTVYRIASVTKTFTATMLMQLRDAGRLQLDDPVAQHVPAVNIKPEFSDRPITFRQLAAHSSGIEREARPANYWASFDFPAVKTMLADLPDFETLMPPLRWVKYSNLGYALLGYALGVIAGQPYEDYVQEHILRPLGMIDTGFALTDAMRQRLAVPYMIRDTPQPIRTADTLGAINPAAGLYATVEDLARYVAFQFRADSTVLHAESLHEMRNPVALFPNWRGGWGIGWELTRLDDVVIVEHGGGMRGYMAHVAFVPDMKLGVILLSNNSDLRVRSVLAEYTAFKILLPVLQRIGSYSVERPTAETLAGWRPYEGLYTNQDDWIRVEIKIIGDQLRFVVVDGAESLSGQVLSALDDHRFRLDEGGGYGEVITFDMDETGNSTGFQNGNDEYFARLS